MADFHQMVVDDVGQMIGGQLVGTLVEHLVVKDVALDDHLSSDEVVDVHLAAGLDEEAHDILAAVGDEFVYFLLRHRQRVAHQHTGVGVVLEVLYFLTFLLQLLRCVEGDIGLALVEQLVDILLIDGATLTLAVGTLVAAEADAFVELDAEPAERLDDVFLGSGYQSRRVGIFDAEHEVAAMLAGKQIVIQCCTDTTNVQRTRRTWCEAHPYSSFCHFFNLPPAVLPSGGLN